ncbi:hypothetical protein B0H11DRAFT_2239309 [Mycena galericulata]|nr:hypothetical protein B0H11DRAFT_2239309 [Mycena galericulata]
MTKNRIDSLPPELIAQVFKHDSRNVYCGKGREIFPPWTYTCVSRRWRDIALENGDLWTNVLVRLGRMSPARLELQLQRARSFPLRVVFKGWNHGRSEEMRKMLELLVRAASCWEQAILHVQPSHLLQLLQVHDNISRLVSVEIIVDGDYVVGPGLPTHSFAIAPALRSVCWRSDPVMSREVMQFPFGTPTSMDAWWTTDFHNNVLAEATALENLRLTGETSHNLGDVKVVGLPRLRFLAIHSMPILYALRLPALTALEMIYPFTDAPLSSLVRRSNVVLKCVRIVGITSGTPAVLSKMLDASPEISTLGIVLRSSNTEQREFLRALTVDPAGGKPIGQKLRTLDVRTKRDYWQDPRDHHLVVALATSRWRQPEVDGICARLMKISVHTETVSLSDTWRESLEALRSEGLEVDVHEDGYYAFRDPFLANQMWW